MKKAVCVILCLLLAASLAGAGLLYAQMRGLRDENTRLEAQLAGQDARIEALTAEAKSSADSLAALSEAAAERIPSWPPCAMPCRKRKPAWIN